MTRKTPEKMYVEGDRAVLGAEVLYFALARGAGAADGRHLSAERGKCTMKLEHFGMAEPGDCRVVFSATCRRSWKQRCRPSRRHRMRRKEEEDLLTAAVNRAILEGFSPLFAQLMEEHRLVAGDRPGL